MRNIGLLLVLLVLTLGLSAGIAGAASMDDLKDKDAKAHVAKFEAVIKRLAIPEEKGHKAYTRIEAAVKEIEPLRKAVEALSDKKDDPKAAKELKLKEAQLKTARNRVYLGLWGDIGEASAKVLAVYALNLATDTAMEKDPNIGEAKKLSAEPIAARFGHITLLMHALMAQMEGKADMKH